MLETKPPEPTQILLPLDASLQPDWKSQVPSVSQLTRRIRGHLEGTFVDIWVRGEISNFRKPVSGHAYFILKDATTSLKVVMFRHNISRQKFQLLDGMEILIHGAVTVYEARGEYQLVADAVEPVGVGALQLAFEELKKRLEKEGLFDPKHKKPLPLLPKRVGVITSATGAAFRDILNVLKRRFFNLEILLIPTSVQGEKAAGEICCAIDLAQKWNRDQHDRALDVLIVGRGGGSIEDLWPFNEEQVARKIFSCEIPVISAVGHEIDFTISDFVADIRAPTPSAAAELVCANKVELVQKVSVSLQRLVATLRSQLAQRKLHLGHLAQRLRDPRQHIQKMKESFQVLFSRLCRSMKTTCLLEQQRLERICQVLNSLSPLQVIGRGYSITYAETGEIIRSIRSIQSGSLITTQLVDGKLRSKVIP